MDGTERKPMPLREEVSPPAIFRWGGAILGVALVSDALRRFLLPGSRRDLYGFLIYLILGGGCLVLVGYRRAFLLGERGLVRETTIWGRSAERLLISWESLTGLSWATGEGTPTLRLAAPGAVWRLHLRRGQEDELHDWIELKRPDLGERLFHPQEAE